MFENLKFMSGGKFISRGKWRHPTRTIDSTELIIVTDGEVHMSVGSSEYRTARGEVLRILPGEGTEEFRIPRTPHFSGFILSAAMPRSCRPSTHSRKGLRESSCFASSCCTIQKQTDILTNARIGL